MKFFDSFHIVSIFACSSIYIINILFVKTLFEEGKKNDVKKKISTVFNSNPNQNVFMLFFIIFIMIFI